MTAQMFYQLNRHFNKVFILLALSGCFNRLELKRGIAALNHGQLSEGFADLERVIKKNPESQNALIAARTGSRVALLEAKNYNQALYFYRHLVLYAPDESERLQAEAQVAHIEFEDLTHYDVAIAEYSKLLQLKHTDEEGFEYQFNVAKAYFQLNNFYQSGVEIDELLQRKLNEDQKFEVLLFKANLNLTEKKLEPALKVYNSLLADYPERAKKENVPLALSVCYEEKGDFLKAIKILNELKSSYPSPDFLEVKIKRLEIRAANLPGAEGLKK